MTRSKAPARKRRSAKSPADQAPSALGLIAEIAAIMALGTDLGAVLTGVVEALGRGLGADCHLWVRDLGADSFRAVSANDRPAPDRSAGDITARDGRVEERDEAAGTWLVSVPLDAAGERVGLLEATIADGPEAATQRDLVGIVARLITPMLALSEQSASLASEVAIGSQTIEAQRRFTSKIIDSLPLSLYVIDREYTVQEWNRNRETGTQGVVREQVLGRSVFDVLSRMPQDLLRREFDTVFRTGRIEQVDVESTHTGETRYYRITKIPMRLHDDSVSHVITIGEDLTDWKSVQQQVALAEKLGAVGQLAAGVMHEINNPLATIGACVEALSVRSPELPDAVREGYEEYLRIIDSELARCKAIVDGLLDFSRPTSRAKRPADLNQIIDDALFLVKHHAKFLHVELRRDLDEGLPRIDGNTEQLIQVFVALMLNALDAMEGKGTLTVRSRLSPERENELVVLVSDTGMGITREDLPKIFEPFFTSKQPGHGTGLGLAICYGIVAQHHGRIQVDSQVGRGSTFSVHLPVISPKE